MIETNTFEELIVMRSKGGDGTIYRQRPLVRCKDCRNAVIYDDNEVVCAHIDSNGNDKHTADWFCADGVAKDSNVLTK